MEKRDDDTWMALARSQLGVTEEVLKGYLKHGDSVLLANLIKTTRLFFEKGIQFQDILKSISGFNVKETLPELQHDFCALWDEIVKKSKNFGDCVFILDELSHVHDAQILLVLRPPRPLLHFPLPPLQITTVCSSDPLMHYAQTHKATTLPIHHNKLLSLRRHLRLLWGSSPVYPLCNATRQTLTLIAYWTPHHCLILYLPFTSSLSRSRLMCLPRWDIHTPQQPLTHSRDVSVSDPDVIVVAGERDVQDMNAHNPHQSDPPVRDISICTSRLGKSVV